MAESKPGLYRTTIAMPFAAKAVCDRYIAEQGLRHNINNFSDLVARALMAYCLPKELAYPEKADDVLPLFEAAEKRVAVKIDDAQKVQSKRK